MIEITFGDKVVASVQIQKDLTESDIEAIVVGSFEGGSNHWMGLDMSWNVWNDRPKDVPVSTWATHLILSGKTVYVYDIEEAEEEKDRELTKLYPLNLGKICKGYKLNYINRSWDNSLENADSTTYDCIIQYGLFGECVYG